MVKRKIALLGGGSAYFERVVGEIALTEDLAGCSLVLYDIDKARMNLIRRASQRIIDKTGARIKLSATGELERALDGADYAISSIGVHGPQRKWHMLDCEVSAEFGAIHTTGDTVGPAGLSQGLRIIPIYLDIARRMKKYCPDVILLNHSNPMSPICRALIKAHGINVIGYCHNIAGAAYWYARVLGVPPHELETVTAGPNHMSWLLSIRHKGRDVYPELKRGVLEGKPEERHMFAREMVKLFDIFPVGNDRHIIEFYPHARTATTPDELSYQLRWRGETTRKAKLDEELIDKASDLELRAAGKKPPAVPREMSPECMGEQIRSMALGHERIHYVNIPNHGAVPNLPSWSVLDLKGVVGSHGARSLYAGELPPQAARWSAAQIYAHELMVDAAIEGSREKALQALACDPMMLNFHEVEPLFDALVKAHGPRLRRFRRRSGAHGAKSARKTTKKHRRR